VLYAHHMNEQARGEPSVPEPDVPEHAAVTGVAKGSVGTGTALEDTQEWIVPPEVQAAAAPDEEKAIPAPVAAAAAASARAAAERPIADGPIEADPTPQAVTAVRGRGPARRRAENRSRGSFAATPRAAGLAAVVLLALVGVAAVVTSQDRTPDAGTAPVDQATLAPTAAPPADEGGGNGGNGKDKKDKNEGGGNGKGNGGGND
jgi:hypothetical protein